MAHEIQKSEWTASKSRDDLGAYNHEDACDFAGVFAIKETYMKVRDYKWIDAQISAHYEERGSDVVLQRIEVIGNDIGFEDIKLEGCQLVFNHGQLWDCKFYEKDRGIVVYHWKDVPDYGFNGDFSAHEKAAWIVMSENMTKKVLADLAALRA